MSSQHPENSDSIRQRALEQAKLATYYLELPTGDRAANLARAIDGFNEVLRLIPADTNPQAHAQVQYQLGLAYAQMPTKGGGFNVESAIPHYIEALRFFTAETSGETYAVIQTQLGNAYRFLENGDRAANRTRAIACYREALRFFSAEAAPNYYAAVQSNLGAAYTQLPTGDRAANLARAIACFTEALRFRTAKATPGEYAETQLYLGIAYANLPTGDPADNLTRAISCYLLALRFFTAQSTPKEYAATQNHLGLAYADLPTGDRATNLARAIDCYSKALQIRTAEKDPFGHAQTLHNIGLACVGLPIKDRAANLARAIDCYTEALRFATAEAYPALYAQIQHSLGVAHCELPTGDVAANLARAIDCFTEALRFRTAKADPYGYAATQNSRGIAFRQLPTGDRAANLAQAIDCYTQALRFRTAKADPFGYAATQNNMGNAYRELRTGDRAANLARAIDCYTQALRFRTAEADPRVYAATQNQLGSAYADLPSGDRAANLARAIDCYTHALQIQPPAAAPDTCRATAYNLGSVYLEQGRWSEAHSAYSTAIRAGEMLYQATGSEAGRQAELGKGRDAVAADAYCLARLGQLAEAVQRLEAGRARALGEALARDRAALQEASPADRKAFVKATEQIKALEAEGRATDATTARQGPQSFAELSSQLVQAREELAEVIKRIRSYLPEFMGEELDYTKVAAAAEPGRPLVYLLSTPTGGLGLLVPAGSQSPAPQHAVWLDGLTTTQLNQLLVQRQPTGEIAGGYLVGQVTGDLNQLAAAVRENIEILRHDVLGPLANRLTELGLDSATIIPVGRLSLLPLPAAAAEGCTIALAPSARVLQAASNALRKRASETPALLAVGNPLPPPAGANPLRWAELEVRAIERFFTTGSRRILPGEAATGKAVTQSLPGTTHLHLACHGAFDAIEPLDSAVYLADGDRLTLRDLLDGNLDLSSQQLAVLSACQTGLIEFNQVPDELIGLPAGFLQAGVPGVVATLWPVNDQSTAVLVAEFYRLLLSEHQNPAAALAQASRFLRDATAHELAEWFERRYTDSGGTDQAAYEAAADLRRQPNTAARPYAHPVFWAGFYYSGP
jgi:CHAT domain-containing protein